MATATKAILILAAAVAVYGCARQAETPTINASMTQIMEPSAEKIWAVASKAYNEVGDGLDPAKIQDTDWQTVAAASLALKQRAELLAATQHFTVAAANEPILGSQAIGSKGPSGAAWDAVGAQTVQARIDAKTDLFRQKMRDLATAADAMHRAAQTKDAALLYRISSGLDETCDSCHEPFWGTDEPPAVHLPGGERVQ